MVHLVFGFCSIIRICILDKSKASRLSCIIISWKIDVLHSSKPFKWNAEIFRPGFTRNISNEETSRKTRASISKSVSAVISTAAPWWRTVGALTSPWAVTPAAASAPAVAPASPPPHFRRRTKMRINVLMSFLLFSCHL